MRERPRRGPGAGGQADAPGAGAPETGACVGAPGSVHSGRGRLGAPMPDASRPDALVLEALVLEAPFSGPPFPDAPFPDAPFPGVPFPGAQPGDVAMRKRGSRSPCAGGPFGTRDMSNAGDHTCRAVRAAAGQAAAERADA
jgi:hypothetical protein